MVAEALALEDCRDQEAEKNHTQACCQLILLGDSKAMRQSDPCCEKQDNAGLNSSASESDIEITVVPRPESNGHWDVIGHQEHSGDEIEQTHSDQDFQLNPLQ